MTYIYCKKVILNMVGTVEELAAKKADMMNKLDVFLLNDRISEAQYNELVGLLPA